MSKRSRMPVQSPGERSAAERAVEESKGGQSRSLSRQQVMTKGEKALNRAREEKARGMTHHDDKGNELETPEQVMAYALAGKTAEVRQPEKDED